MGLFPKDRNLADSPDRVELFVRAKDFQIRPDELSIRLDAFLLRRMPWRSRASIQRLIRGGYVLADFAAPERGSRAEGESGKATVETRCGRLLRDGTRIVVIIPEELRLPAVTSDSGSLVVLYEDDDVVCVDKPPGLVVHPSGRHVTDSLIQRIHARYRADDSRERIPIRLCHRLDRETSGIVVCGKGERAHREIMLQFEARKIEKEYLAIVRGSPQEETGVIDHAIGPARASAVRLKMTVSVNGLPSETHWSVVERHGDYTLVACKPLTGRQHQIRVHMDAIGHPLVGDKLYGLGEEYFLRHSAGELTPDDLRALGMPRHALHNHRIAWRSPRTGERREATSPLAEDMRAFLARADSSRPGMA